MSVAMKFVGNRIPALHGHEQDFGQAVIKGAEMLGKVTPAQAREYMDEAFETYVGTGGIVNPLMMAQANKFSRSARFGKDKDWHVVLGYLLEESGLGRSGGGSANVGPMVRNLDKVFGQGKMNKEMIGGLMSLDVLKKSDAMETMTMETMLKTRLKGFNEFVANPFKWYVNLVLPALAHKRFPNLAPKEAVAAFDKLSEVERISFHRQYLPGMTALAEDPMIQFMLKHNQIQKFMDLRNRQLNIEQSLHKAHEETAFHTMQVAAHFDLLAGRLGLWMAPALNTVIDGVDNFVAFLADLDGHFPETTKALGDAMNFLGTVAEDVAKKVNAIDWKGVESFIDKLGATAIKHPAGAVIAGGGAVGGAVVGAEIGSAAGPIGTVVGGVMGAIIGGAGGVAAAKAAHQAGVTEALEYSAKRAALGKSILEPRPIEGMPLKPPMFTPPPIKHTANASAPVVNLTLQGVNVPTPKMISELANLIARFLAANQFMHNATVAQAGGNWHSGIDAHTGNP
jgi:hypothetical protein